MMRKAHVTSLCLAALLAASGHVALADTMVGGNGLCADPASLGPNAPVGAYTPVKDPKKNENVEELARLGAIYYLFTPAAQTPEDKEILKQCGANKVKLVESIDIIAACSQVVQGTNYLVEFTVTVPCSAANKQKLPPGVDLTRTVRVEGYVPLPENGKDSLPEVTGAQGVTPEDDFCGKAGLAGGFNDVSDPSDDEQVVASAKLAAASYWDNDQSDDFKKAVKACGATKNEFVDSVQVTRACSQVVAGTNYRVQFTATIPCDTENTQDLPEGFLLKRGFISEVFQPLPNSNEAPKVDFVEDTGGLLGGSTIGSTGAILEADAATNETEPALAGGFTEVANPSNDEQILDLAKLAAASYWENDQSDDFKKAVKACDATEEDFVDSVQVSRAASQVVAGTNYDIQFTATIPCSEENSMNVPDGFILKQGFTAKVFQPLPSSNEAPKVDSVENTGGLLGGGSTTEGASTSAPDSLTEAAEMASGATGVALGTTGLAMAGLVLMFA